LIYKDSRGHLREVKEVIRMQELLKRYLEYVQNEKKHPYSDNTMRSIRNALEQFIHFYKGDIEDFTKKDLEAYKEFLLSHPSKTPGKTYNINTVNQRLNHLKKFFQVCKYEFGREIDLFIETEKVQQQNIIDMMLENNDVRKMLNLNEDALTEILIYGLFYTGSRVSELLQIKTKDYKEKNIMVLGKGRKFRNLFIPDVLTKVWSKYLKNHTSGSDYLFSISDTKRLTRSSAYKRLERLAMKATVEKERVHPHAFRHLYARNLSDNGIQTAIIKQLLGHTLDVTEGYLQISREQLMKVINNIKL
jgi:integrase/recombinase XerD